MGEDDWFLLRGLATACAPMDVHTPYTYWVLCTRFSTTCFVLLHDNEPIGFLTAVRNGNELFIWRVGVLPEWRGQGLAQTLIHYIVSLRRPNEDVRLTIAPDNYASLGAFQAYCEKHGLQLVREPGFDPDVCPDKEITYRITDKARGKGLKL